jgi:hypothetical protein
LIAALIFVAAADEPDIDINHANVHKWVSDIMKVLDGGSLHFWISDFGSVPLLLCTQMYPESPLQSCESQASGRDGSRQS